MKLLRVLTFLVYVPSYLLAQVPFGDFFQNTALRVDLYLSGDAKQANVTLDRISEEGPWPESPGSLIEPFQNGRYLLKVYDVATNRLTYARGFDCMFGEYTTTTPALKGIQRTFSRSLRIPCPRRPVQVVLELRDRENIPRPLYTTRIDPTDYHIIRQNPSPTDDVYEAMINGESRDHVDVVFLAEGYTAGEGNKFRADVDRMVQHLFTIEPYKSAKSKFNIRGIHRASAESGPDEPEKRIYKNTVLKASFNAFDLDRYMLTEENRLLREMAGQVPYDAIVVLVNSPRYGGGGIYNDFAITSVDNAASLQVFVHEFGHSFAGLGDEYYSSAVAYNDFYPKGVEPLEPNITALLDPSALKWKDLLSPGIALPTPYGRQELDSLQELRRTLREDQRKAVDAKIEEVRKRFAGVYDRVGAFEGAGYSSTGLYRPMVYCLMIGNPKNEFCLVCRKAISRMITYYSQP